MAYTPTRRALLASLGTAAVATALPATHAAASAAAALRPDPGFLDVLRQPDLLRVFREDNHPLSLERHGEMWAGSSVTVRCTPGGDQLGLQLLSPTDAVTYVHLRWNGKLPSTLRVLGDAWERSYGELSWSVLRPEAAMPWYFLAFTGSATHGYGMRTGAGSFAFWQCDTDGISLWLDTRNGGNGVRLGKRPLDLATVVMHRGRLDEDPFAAAQALCRAMASGVKLAASRGRNSLSGIYGTNDWYYAYGQNTAEGTLRDASLVAELAPSSGPRPWAVIDAGWGDVKRFGDVQRLPEEIRARGAAPGIWVRPLLAEQGADKRLLLPDARYGIRKERFADLAFDPTIPEALALAVQSCSAPARWGFDLLKADFLTYDFFGQWGFEMHSSPALAGWNLHDRSVTNAEAIAGFYRAMRTAAGDSVTLLGCNAVGHLSAGTFDGQRTGDDTSGKVWERTRRMGVNTLAFRLPQNRTFFFGDADCVAITPAIPWSLTEQWLRAVAASGTALFISPHPGSIGAEQKRAIREAFAIAASGKAAATPSDWLFTPAPSAWKRDGVASKYDWLGPEGALPFEV